MRRYGGLIVAAVRGIAPTHGDIEDLTQEVFVRLCKDDFRLLRTYDPARAGAVDLAHDRRAQHRPRRAAPAPAEFGADRGRARGAARGRPGRAGAQAEIAGGAAVAAAARDPGDAV